MRRAIRLTDDSLIVTSRSFWSFSHMLAAGPRIFPRIEYRPHGSDGPALVSSDVQVRGGSAGANFRTYVTHKMLLHEFL